jgi:cytosine/adenosine deaminase-related metal-dependent hydrolase
MGTLIRDATILTVDTDNRVLERAAIYVEESRIKDIGDSRAVAARQPPPDRVIDGAGKVVAPGFVSTHNHLGYTMFRGRAEDASLDCVTGMYLPMGSIATRAERLACGSLSYAELLRGGVTTTVEMEEDADVFAPFVERLGARSMIGVQMQDVEPEGVRAGRFEYRPELREAQLAQAIGFAEEWHGKAHGRITVMMAPNMTIFASPELLAASRQAADRLGLRLSTHLGWGQAEVEIVRRLHGVSPAEFLHSHGLMAPDTILAHCYVMDDPSVDVLAHSGACVAHCPVINAARGQIAPIEEFRRRGITVGLGIDGMFADHFEVLRSTILMARVKSGDPLAIPAPEALRLATIEGAKALGMAAEIGSIEVGKRADLQVIDCRRFGLRPTLDPVANLVYHAHAADVVTVLVDGHVVVDGGTLVHADAEQLLDAAEDAAQEAWARFIVRHGDVIARD